MSLIKPDWVDGPSDARWVDVEVDRTLVRIGHKDYDGLAYNPNPVKPNYPNKRGRFSGTIKDPHGSLYAAEHITDERVAILEMLEHKSLDHNPHGAVFWCKPAIVKDLSFFYLKVRITLPLVTLTAGPDAMGYGADEDTIYSNNYWYTREWARYIRKKVPDAKGIEYSPKRYRDTRAGTAMVLFDDRLPNDALELVGDPVPLASPEGRRIFLNCKPFTRVAPDW